jgi:MerR family transcriptional regulator/heat shock protein HspR
MARKKSEIQPIHPATPVYPIGVAARLVNVHPCTLRTYASAELVKPTRIGSRQMFSTNDIHWIGCMRSLIHAQGISIPGLKKLLQFAPCWEIADCPSEIHENCHSCVDQAAPRTLYAVGDGCAAGKAKEADREKRKKVGQGNVARHLGPAGERTVINLNDWLMANNDEYDTAIAI